MSFSDDDDLEPTYSTQEAFTRSDGGKREKLKAAIKKMFGVSRQLDTQKASLSSKQHLKELQNQLAGKRDEETKRKEKNDQQNATSNAPKTKTLKEQEESSIETAQEVPDSDTMIQRQQEQKHISDEETTPEPG